MKNFLLLLLTLLALPIGMQADALRDSLPSNYGNWLNLTEGYSQDHSEDHHKMEVAIDGNTIHLAWVEFAKQSDNSYRVWYRRSTDLGKTWENAKVVLKLRNNNVLNINSGALNHYMVVSNGKIHMVFTQNKNNDDEKSHLIYMRSDDGGATFTSQVIGEKESRYDWYSGAMIAADGNFVVVGAGIDGSSDIFYYTSKDGGNTFNEQKQTLEHNSRTANFYDLQASNGHWVSMTYGSDWYGALKYGYLYMTVSDGATMTSQNIAPLHSDGTPYAFPDVMHGANRSSYNYHPQVAMEGNTIHVMYMGNPGGKEKSSDYEYTLYQKSTDGGKTWSKAIVLPESNGTHGTIAAKGNNVYILSSASGGRRVVYYSNDGGKNWAIQDQCTWTERYANNPTNSYSLVIDPYDTTGKHAFMTGNRFYYMETKDGFQSICKNFVLGDEAFCGSNNYALSVLSDKNGMQHWFLQYQKPIVTQYGNANIDNSSTDICYRRVDAEPEPSGTKALNLTDEKMIDYRVVIPMTQSLMLKQAITVETWVRLDSISTFQIAGTSQECKHETSQYNGGWYIKADNWYGDGGYFEAGIRTDKAVDDVGTRIYNKDALRIYQWKKWHHVAFTYDANAGEKNARLYIDGMLVAAETLVGGIQMGSNPIALGTANGYGSKGMLDHFAIFNRALTAEELQQHIQSMPTGKENGCVCLLNFDGTLKDMSGNGNDGVALLDVDFVNHDGIRFPKPDFAAIKDVGGKNITLMDKSSGGQAVWWFTDKGPDYYSRYLSSTSRQMRLKDIDPGNYVVNMVACSDNAYAGMSKVVMIAGLTRVYPDKAAPSDVVRVKILGGYDLSYSKQPRVALRNAKGEIEGKWDVDRNFSMKNVESSDDMPDAVFDLRTAELGKYDVVVGDDVLEGAFEVVAGDGYPDVSVEVNGRDKMLFNKYQIYSIDFCNNSNVAAYNTPFTLFVSDKDGHIELSFDFPIDCYGEDIPQVIKDFCKDYENGVVVNTPYGPMRGYVLNIPYIAPHGEAHYTFRVRLKDGDTSAPDIDMVYACGLPLGAYDPDKVASARSRAGEKDEWQDKLKVHDGWDMSLAECLGDYFYGWFKDAAIGSIPGVGCVYGIHKAKQAMKESHDWAVANMFVNTMSAGLSCLGTVVDVATLGGSWVFHTAAEFIWNGISNVVSVGSCLAQSKKYRHLVAVRSYDPNEMIGPAGYDDNAHYIKPIRNMAYTITYENKASATAPAHEVFINDKLDASKYDLSTFSFTSFGWAGKTWSVGGIKTKEFTRDILYTVKGTEILVRVSGAFDEKTGEVNWSMVSLKKNGDEIDDPDLGYLLPNNDNGDGEGFVSFSIEHKPNPSNGSTISNKASIVFDANAPIETNTYVNTFDTDYPTSKATKVELSGSNLVLTFEGTDATSGIAGYNIYVFKNSGVAELAGTVVTGNSFSIPYDTEVSYAFCVIAQDNAGWFEAKDIKPEIEYVSSGINSIILDDMGSWTIYSVDGKRVFQNKGQKQLSLPAGVYVIHNGKTTRKVVIK